MFKRILLLMLLATVLSPAVAIGAEITIDGADVNFDAVFTEPNAPRSEYPPRVMIRHADVGFESRFAEPGAPRAEYPSRVMIRHADVGFESRFAKPSAPSAEYPPRVMIRHADVGFESRFAEPGAPRAEYPPRVMIRHADVNFGVALGELDEPQAKITLYTDDFEDGDASDWIGGYYYGVADLDGERSGTPVILASSDAARSGSFGLRFTKDRQFVDSPPAYIAVASSPAFGPWTDEFRVEFDIIPDIHNHVIWLGEAGPFETHDELQIARFGISFSEGTIGLRTQGYPDLGQYEPDTFYHVTLNANPLTNLFDVKVTGLLRDTNGNLVPNGVLSATGLDFESPVSAIGIRRINLFTGSHVPPITMGLDNLVIGEQIDSSMEISLYQPSSKVTVAKGDEVTISWSGSGPTGSSVSLRSDSDKTWENGGESWITLSQPVSGSYSWDTKDVPVGTYYIAAMITDGNTEVHAYAAGTVTISDTTISDMTISLSDPSPASVTKGDKVNITWSGSAPAGSSVSLSRDSDKTWESGGESWITLSQPLSGSYSWDTVDVPAGTYYIAAMITDGNTEVHAYAAGTVTVNVGSGRTLTIGSVDASPGTSAVVQLSISDATGLASGDIVVNYDASVITIDEVNGTNLISGITLVVNKDVPGEIRLPMAGATGIPSGSGALVEIELTVDANAVIGTRTTLSFGETELYDELAMVIPVNLENGVVNITQPGIKGDVNNDGRIRSNDATLTLRIVAGLMTPTDHQQWAADMNGDGRIRSNDATLILRKVAGLAPDKGVVTGAGRQATVMLSEARGIAGEQVTVPVRVDNADILASGDICIAYDPTVLRATEVSSDPDMLLVSNVTEPGTVRIAFASVSGLNGQTVAEIQFEILADDISPLRFRDVELYNLSASPISSIGIDKKFVSWAIPPECDALMQNFPNPFNPETWIPYQLRESSDVTIRIYSMSGNLVRELDLGHKSPGVYVNSHRAVHWDGRNEAGEQVSSGVYFYAIQAGDYTAVKKMTITR